jgi:hypothetical protein
MIERRLTGELADARSPVRRFFRSRFSGGLRNVQSRYRHSAPALTVPPVQRTEVGLGTVEITANWLLRFLLHSSPALELAADHSAAVARPAARGELAPAGPESRQ